MKIKIEQITILIVLILIVIAALIMIGYRRVLKMEERIEGLEKVLLAVKKGADFEHPNHQHNIIDPSQNILNMNNGTMQDIKSMNAEHLNNFFQQNSGGNIQVNEANTDNISIHSLSESSDFDEDATEVNNITKNNDNQDEQDEDNISEISDDEDNESIEENDSDEDNESIEDNDNEEEDTHEVEVLKSDGLNILMQEEKSNPIRNMEYDIHTLSIEELNSNFKRPELFLLCAKNRIKVNKREDKKGDLINRIVDFQKKNVSKS